MKTTTKSEYSVTVGEIVKALGIDGELLAFGFNTTQKTGDKLSREIKIIVINKVKK